MWHAQEGLELHRSASWKSGHHTAEGWRITGKAPSKAGPGAAVLELPLTGMHAYMHARMEVAFYMLRPTPLECLGTDA